MRTFWAIWVLSLAVGSAYAEGDVSQPGSGTGLTTAAEATTQDDPAIDVHDLGDVVDANDRSSGCAVEPVVLKRAGFPGPLVLSLTSCDGEPSAAALLALSELAQPAREHGDTGGADGDHASVHALNAGLLERLQQIADHYPGHAIEIVSGYRPNARVGSRHRSADALDLRLDGVDNAELSAFLRALAATGVGYYPNSGFVHVDVRKEAFYWVDNSGPGQAPRYETALAANALALDKATPPSGALDKLGSGNASQQTAKAVPEQAAVGETVKAVLEAAASAEAPAPASAVEAAGSGQTALPVPTQAELDAELRSLAERALVVMNAALGHAPSSSSALPTRSDQ
jgi:hypothetical protein